MPRYKRTRDEAELDLDLPPEPAVDPEHAETLAKLRNMWEFASLMQYVFMFGQVVKIDDDLDIEVRPFTTFDTGPRFWVLMMDRCRILSTSAPSLSRRRGWPTLASHC